MSDLVERLRDLAGEDWLAKNHINEAADEIERLRAELAAINGQEPDAVLHKDGHAPLEVRISEKHDYGCKLPHGTKFYLRQPVADKDAERWRAGCANTDLFITAAFAESKSENGKAVIDAAIDAAMARGE